MKRIIILLFTLIILTSCSQKTNNSSGGFFEGNSESVSEKQKDQNELSESVLNGKTFILPNQSNKSIKFKDDNTVEFNGESYKYSCEKIKDNEYIIYTDTNYSISYDKSKAMITFGDARTEYFYDSDSIEIIDINMDNFEKYFSLQEEIISDKKNKFNDESQDNYYYYYVFKDTSINLIEGCSYVALKYSVYGDHEDYVIDRTLVGGKLEMDACSARDFSHRWDSFEKNLINVVGKIYVINNK